MVVDCQLQSPVHMNKHGAAGVSALPGCNPNFLANWQCMAAVWQALGSCSWMAICSL